LGEGLTAPDGKQSTCYKILKGLSLGRLLWNDLSIGNLSHAYRKVEVNLKERDYGKHVGLDGRMILK
jgi:hypothetical protein